MTRPAATLQTGISSFPGTPLGCAVVSAAAGPRLLMGAGWLLPATARVRRPVRALVNTLTVIALLVLLLPVLGPLAYAMGL